MGWLMDLLFGPADDGCLNCGEPCHDDFCSRRCAREMKGRSWLGW